MKAGLLGGAWLAGISLAYLSDESVFILAVAAAVAALLAGLRLGAGWAIAAGLVLVAGAFRFTAGPAQPSDLIETDMAFTAVVEDDARDAGPRTAFPARIEESSADSWEGRRILVATPAFLDVEYGELFRASGVVVPLDEDEPADQSLIASGLNGRLTYPAEFDIVAQGHGEWWREPLIDLRTWASERMDSVLPEPVSALARGMVLGERSDIDSDLRRDLNDSGISHLIAISGQNVVLLAGLITVSMSPLVGRRGAAFAALAAVSAYAALLGAPPAILRAALMGSLFVLAPVVGRQAGGVGLLMFSGMVLTAIDPGIIRSISFQLSFAAVGGLMLLAVPIGAALSAGLEARGRASPTVLIEVVSVTTAAWLATLPIIAINFDQFSLVGFAANPLVAPIFAPMLVSALVTIPASYLPEAFQLLLSWPAWVLFGYFRLVGETAADLPGASIDVSGFTSVHAVAVYAALFAFPVLVKGRTVIAELERPIVLRPGSVLFLPALLALNVLVWPTLVAREADEMRVSFLDVGQGDAALIETPEGSRILVDGGPDPARLIRELDDQLGFGSRRIDLVLLTHMDTDHATGLMAVLDRYDVGLVGWNGIDDGSPLAEAWHEAVERSGARQITLASGQDLLVDGLRLRVLWPDYPPPVAENDASLVIRISFQDVDVLLTGDIGIASEAALLASGVELEAEVLKVAHHGSPGSTLTEFLLAVDPDFAVIQSGASNPFGHPATAVLTRLDAAGAVVLRNDLNGTITLVSDGSSAWRK